MLRSLTYATIFTVVALLIISFHKQLHASLMDNLYGKSITVTYNDLSPQAKEEVKCLADNIFFEAAFEPVQGRVAVAMVTMNRVSSHYYPDDICGVVKQKIRNTCQFSWWCQDRERTKAIKSTLTPDNNSAYNEAMQIALDVYLNQEMIKDPSYGALFYHADYVNPKWRNLTVTTKIGRHIFYVKNANFKKGDVRNGSTYDAETKPRVELERQQTRPISFILSTDGRN
jgi:hypothetical protein